MEEPQHSGHAPGQHSAQFAPHASHTPPSQHWLQSSPQHSAQSSPQHAMTQHPSPVEPSAPGETVERLEHPAAIKNAAKPSKVNIDFMEELLLKVS